MGAEYQSRFYNIEDTDEVKKRWDADVEMSLSERGNSYSGDIGMLGHGFNVTNQRFDTVREADEWLCANHEKWSTALAVRVKSGQLKGETKKSANMRNRITILQNKRDDMFKDIFKKFKSAKSKFHTCKGCGSRLNRKYVPSSMLCPLCSDPVTSPTDRKRMARADELIEEAQKKYRSNKETKLSSGYGWLIGGWCSS